MKRICTLIVWAAAASIAAGPAVALECARGNAPAATLLVPYFRVSRNGVTRADAQIPDLERQVDTLLAVTNTSDTGLVVHVTVWSKYGVPVLGFNVPMTAWDVMTFRMKDVLNGHLGVNPTTQDVLVSRDPCGIDQSTGIYAPHTGVGQQFGYIRFVNPDAADAAHAVSIYADPAFESSARVQVWDSLDESGDVTQMAIPGAFVVDADNACGAKPVDGILAGDFSGSVTFDVVNYCTNLFPTDAPWWTNGVLATAGWGNHGPNALIGDVFYIDNTDNGNISGDPMVALRYLPALGGWNGQKTFYGRYDGFVAPQNPAVPDAFRFVGDGREALGTRYGLRYLDDLAQGLRTSALIYRTDRYASGSLNLCAWAAGGTRFGDGFFDAAHQVVIHTYDADENVFQTSSSANPLPPPPSLYVFLESQRMELAGNGDINPGGFLGGWIDIDLPGSRYGQGFVGVEHSGHGAFLSVGHAASPLKPESCGP